MLPTPAYCIATWLVLACVPRVARGQQLPDWTGKIRTDRPRLFFNAPTGPAVKQRALGAEHDWYRRVQLRVEMFNATGDLGGHLRRTGSAPVIDRPRTSAVQLQSGLMLRTEPPILRPPTSATRELPR